MHLLYVGFVAGCIHWKSKPREIRWSPEDFCRRRVKPMAQPAGRDGSPWHLEKEIQWSPGSISISDRFWLACTKVCFFAREWFRYLNMLHHVAGYEYTGFTGFHMCIAKTHSINFNCWGGPSMWAEFGAIHAVPWMEAVTQRCHILQGDLAVVRNGWPSCFKGALDTRAFTSKEHTHKNLFQTKAILGMTGKIKQSA